MAYARLATRNTSGLHPNLRGLGFLGDSLPLSPTTAMQQAIQKNSNLRLNPRDFQNQAFLSSDESQIAAGQINLQAYSPSCAGQAAPNLNMFSTASGLALGTTAATTGILASLHTIPAAVVPVVGWVVAGVGAVIGIISAIFQHHAAAVRRDLAFGCSAIPAVNNAFSVIAQGVQNGQIKPADAAAALDQIASEYHSAGGAAINDSPWCNSNCEIGVLIDAMIIYWKAQYMAIDAQQKAIAAEQTAQATEQLPTSAQSLTSPAVPASAITESTGTTGGFSLSQIPAWGWLLAAAFGAWAVM